MKTQSFTFVRPLLVTYFYMNPDFKGGYIRYSTNVEVISETEKFYIIRLKEPIYRHLSGDIMKVHKYKIVLNVPKPKDVSYYWYNK